MHNCYCICPTFVGKHISDSKTFVEIFLGYFLEKRNQLVFDNYGEIKNHYLQSVKDDPNSFALYKTWVISLDEVEKSQPGKIIKTNQSINLKNDIHDFIYNTIASAQTTFPKSIITNDTPSYFTIHNQKNSNIHILSSGNICTSSPRQLLEVSAKSSKEFEVDLEWIIHRIVRSARKFKDENDVNDFVRDLISAKYYHIKEQAREGSSPSGIAPGELDIVVEQSGRLFTIIEALVVDSLKSNYIIEHYKKLLTSYNPLGTQGTYLVVYYNGNNISEWWKKYIKMMSSLNINLAFGNVNFQLERTEECNTEYTNLKKMIQYFSCSGESFFCVHYAIKVTI